jgi:hypothetical protein
MESKYIMGVKHFFPSSKAGAEGRTLEFSTVADFYFQFLIDMLLGLQ